jgi:L-fuculose-phosphate aldolase
VFFLGRKRQQKKNEMALRQQLVEFGRMLHKYGFVSACDGNLSIRMDEERVLVTPTGFSKGMMQPEDMVVVDMDGNRIFGTRKASSEIPMHLTIYRLRDDVHAVVHAHPCTATAFAAAGLALDEPVCSEIVIALGSVPLAPYATPGTDELGESLEPFIASHDAILMANHGVVTYAGDLLHAYLKMETVEHYAKIVLATRQLGSRRKLSPGELVKLHDARAMYLHNGN